MENDVIEQKPIDLDTQVGNLLEQLNTINKIKVESAPFTIDKNNLEDFVIQHSGRLVKQSVDLVSEIKNIISSGGTPDEVMAVAELIRATASAIESMNKIVIQDKRASTQEKLKHLDYEAKKNLLLTKNAEDSPISHAVRATREELFEKILREAKVIDLTE